MNKRFAAALAGGACLLSANPAFAGISTTTIDVSANVRASCTIMNDSSLAFGALDTERTNYATGILQVNCNTREAVSMVLNSFNGDGPFRMVDQQGGMLPYTVRVGNTDRQDGQPFSIPVNTMISIQAEVNSYAAREATAGSYTDRLYVDVVY